MKIRSTILTLFVTLAFGTVAMADKHEPPPPKGERQCTIGWYKNNGLDTWYPQCASILDAGTCAALHDDLYATGAKAGDTKNAAADIIVAQIVGFENESCEEAD